MTWIITPFARVGGRLKFNPPLYTIIQTDGSFHTRTKTSPSRGRIAAVICANNTNIPFLNNVVASSSNETEWASVVFGIQKALDQNLERIAIENDCLPVIEGIIDPDRKLKHEYALHYRDQIQRLAAHTEWTGARWIPRELNKADDLFR